jgi:hypothetical protein
VVSRPCLALVRLPVGGGEPPVGRLRSPDANVKRGACANWPTMGRPWGRVKRTAWRAGWPTPAAAAVTERVEHGLPAVRGTPL